MLVYLDHAAASCGIIGIVGLKFSLIGLKFSCFVRLWAMYLGVVNSDNEDIGMAAELAAGVFVPNDCVDMSEHADIVDVRRLQSMSMMCDCCYFVSVVYLKLCNVRHVCVLMKCMSRDFAQYVWLEACNRYSTGVVLN